MKTIDRIVQEVEAEAAAWLKEAAPWIASPGPLKTATFGPGRGTEISVQYDEVRENWHIFATGPSDPHSGGIPLTSEGAREGGPEWCSRRWRRRCSGSDRAAST